MRQIKVKEFFLSIVTVVALFILVSCKPLEGDGSERAVHDGTSTEPEVPVKPEMPTEPEVPEVTEPEAPEVTEPELPYDDDTQAFKTLWKVPAGGTLRLPLVAEYVQDNEYLYMSQASGATITYSYDFAVDWGDGSDPVAITSWDDPDVFYTYANTEEQTYTVTIRGRGGELDLSGWSLGYRTREAWYYPFTYEYKEYADMFLDVLQWGASSFVDSNGAFQNCKNLISFSAEDTPHIAGAISRMFANNEQFNQNLNHWDFSEVTALAWTFEDSTAFNNGDPPGVSNTPLRINTQNMLSLRETFDGATAFNQDVRSWDTTTVETMFATFLRASSFNQNLSNWNISRVESMHNFAKDSGITDPSYHPLGCLCDDHL